jgi:type IV pilus assembly protein PilB
MDSKLLLKSLVDANLLTQESSAAILRDAASLRRSAEDIIVERRLVPEDELAKAKSQILGVPFRAVAVSEISPEILKSIPENTARAYKVAPLSREKNLLVVGMVNPDDPAAQEALRYVARQQKVSLGVYLITQRDFDAILRMYSPLTSEVAQAVKSLGAKDEASPFHKKVQLEAGAKVAEEAPIIKIVASLLREAVSMGASDIHIEPQKTRLRVRFRVDGRLQEQTSLPATLHQPVISRVKVLSNLKIDENRIPQDGRFRSELLGRDIDFRVSTFPTPWGEKVAIRVLDPNTGLKNLNDLGLRGQAEEVVRRGMAKPFGMILITGPTGSGKSTTLYAILQGLDKEGSNIVSLEDPVEYFIEGVNQSQVRPEIDYDFASGLRQILRQDPDIIMVGEIRDQETAALAVHAALTGHLVFSTLHTNNAIGVIPRLIDMKVDSFLLPSAISVMASQRLAAKLCADCKTAEKPKAEVAYIIKRELDKLSDRVRETVKFKEPYQIYHSPGCDACNGKGVMGRIGIFEAFEMTDSLASAISSGITEAKIRDEAARQGMVTMRQDGILKALEGIISIEEVLKETAE